MSARYLNPSIEHSWLYTPLLYLFVLYSQARFMRIERSKKVPCLSH